MSTPLMMSTEELNFNRTLVDSEDSKVTEKSFEIITNSTTAKDTTEYTTIISASTDDMPATTSSISTFTSNNEFSKSAPFQFETKTTIKRPCNRTSESHRTIRSSCHEHDDESEKTQEVDCNPFIHNDCLTTILTTTTNSMFTIPMFTKTPRTTTLPFQQSTSKLSTVTTTTKTTKTAYVTPLSIITTTVESLAYGRETQTNTFSSLLDNSQPMDDWNRSLEISLLLAKNGAFRLVLKSILHQRDFLNIWSSLRIGLTECSLYWLA